MAFNSEKEFTHEFDPNFDYVLSEGGSTSINLRKVSWNGNPFTLDIRRYSYAGGEERMMKGISLKQDAADELAVVLVHTGYGNTERLVRALRNREDFSPDMLTSEEYADPEPKVKYSDSPEEDEGYYDPKKQLGALFLEEEAS